MTQNYKNDKLPPLMAFHPPICVSLLRNRLYGTAERTI